MKARRHFLPPRQLVIYTHTRRMLDETRMDATAFGMRVAELYIGMTAPDVRQGQRGAGGKQIKLRLGEGDELLKAMENNGQVVRRYMDGTVKTFPADLEDAWVLALPEPYRGDCERDLARRRDFLPVRVTPPTAEGEAVSIGALICEFGQLCEALAPALADGRLNEADRGHARRILNESDDVLAKVLNLRRQVQALLPDGG